MSFGFDFCGGDGGIPIAAKDLKRADEQSAAGVTPKLEALTLNQCTATPKFAAVSTRAPGAAGGVFSPSMGPYQSPGLPPRSLTTGNSNACAGGAGTPYAGANNPEATPKDAPAPPARRNSFLASFFSLPGSASGVGSGAGSPVVATTAPAASTTAGGTTPHSTPSDGLSSRTLSQSQPPPPPPSAVAAPSPSFLGRSLSLFSSGLTATASGTSASAGGCGAPSVAPVPLPLEPGVLSQCSSLTGRPLGLGRGLGAGASAGDCDVHALSFSAALAAAGGATPTYKALPTPDGVGTGFGGRSPWEAAAERKAGGRGGDGDW